MGLARPACSGRRAVGDTRLWSGEHATSSHALKLEQRPDRNLLVSLYEQSRQICSLQAKRFTGRLGDLPGPQPGVLPRNHPILEEMLKIMIPVAEKYQSAELQVDQLKDFREKLMAELGYEPLAQKGAVKKRPAAYEPQAEAERAEAATATPMKKKRVPAKTSPHAHEGANDEPQLATASTASPAAKATAKATATTAAVATSVAKARSQPTRASTRQNSGSASHSFPPIPMSLSEELDLTFGRDEDPSPHHLRSHRIPSLASHRLTRQPL